MIARLDSRYDQLDAPGRSDPPAAGAVYTDAASSGEVAEWLKALAC
jgi:hypothetical protein